MEALKTKKHHITSERAAALIARYQQSKPTLIDAGVPGAASVLPDCEFFKAEAVKALLNMPGCTTLKVCLGMYEDGRIVSILQAADDGGNPVLPALSAGKPGKPVATLEGDDDPNTGDGEDEGDGDPTGSMNDSVRTP